MANQAQPGIIVTQAGVSAPYAADYQMVFNSNWPSLAVAFEAVVTVTTSATINHGLGFFPFVQAWTILNGVSVGRTFGFSGNLSGPQNDVQLTFDKQNIYLTNNAFFNATYTISVKCYNIDISKSADYTLPAPPVVKTPYDPTTGIKVVKYGKSIGSTDLRDFILHSRAQSPAILSIKTGSDAYWGQPFGTYYIYNIFYINPANYTPWAFSFFYNGSVYYGLAPGAQQSGNSFTLTNNLSGFGTQVTSPTTLNLSGSGAILSFQDANNPATNSASLVVIRDPLVVANTKQVTY